MSQDMERAAELVEDLRFVDDRELIDDDVVGCLGSAADVLRPSYTQTR